MIVSNEASQSIGQQLFGTSCPQLLRKDQRAAFSVFQLCRQTEESEQMLSQAG